jgi:RNA polymerase sigma-70 factor (ECF subfamily)
MAKLEDVIQDADARAYEHLEQFAGRAKFSNWLTCIAVEEAVEKLPDGYRTIFMPARQSRT